MGTLSPHRHHHRVHSSHNAPLVVLLLLLLLPLTSPSAALNATAILAAHPDFTAFTRLLSSAPAVAADLSSRSSLTLLAVPNSFLSPLPADLSDVLRYHVLLEYLSWPDLRLLPSSGRLVTNLYQTTGRAPSDLGGALNLTRSPSTGAILARSPSSGANATFLSLLASHPYNISIFSVSALLFPPQPDLAASQTLPHLLFTVNNITKILFEAHELNVAAAMLEASGVAEELEDDQRGAGITVFVPTDEAFAAARLQSLPAETKAVVLRFHVLHSYYPLGSLESIVNPVQPTLATENTGAGRFTLNISRVNGSVAIDTGVVQASITRTVFDRNPVSVFAVSRVLLPREIFGRGSGEEEAAAPVGMAPEEAETPPTRLSSPPGTRGGYAVASAAGRRWRLLIGGGAVEICTDRRGRRREERRGVRGSQSSPEMTITGSRVWVQGLAVDGRAGVQTAG